MERIEKIKNVTHVKAPGGNHLVGVNLSEGVQTLLREKASEYGVTAQHIADEACFKAREVSTKIIEDYVNSL